MQVNEGSKIGNIYFSTGRNVEKKGEYLKVKEISEVFLIENHQSHKNSDIKSIKESYRSLGYNPKTFIVIDLPPAEKWKAQYEFSGPYNLAILVNYCSSKIITGKNIYLDFNEQSACKNLIMAALASKKQTGSSEEAANVCKNVSKDFQLSETQTKMLNALNYFLKLPIVSDIKKAPMEIPFELPGKVFHYVTPRMSLFDGGAHMQTLKDAKVDTIMVLQEDEEMEVSSCTDLITLYNEEGFEVEHFPIPDRSVPELDKMRENVLKLEKLAKEGRNIAVHCWAGNGRTGLVLGCLAKHLLKLSPEDAIKFVKKYNPKFLESDSQKEMVSKF